MESGSSGSGSTTVFNPEVGSSYRNGWNQLWKNFGMLLVIGIAYFILGSVFSVANWIQNGFYSTNITTLDWVGIIYSIFFITPLGLGVFYAYLKAARGEKPEFADMFKAFGNYPAAVIAPVISGIIVGIGTLFFIIPGIYLACKLAFVPLAVGDKKKGPFEAIGESWQMSDGFAMDVFLIGLLAIPIFIAGAIVFGVGIIISYMWVYLALASLYHSIDIHKGGAGQPTI